MVHVVTEGRNRGLTIPVYELLDDCLEARLA